MLLPLRRGPVSLLPLLPLFPRHIAAAVAAASARRPYHNRKKAPEARLVLNHSTHLEGLLPALRRVIEALPPPKLSTVVPGRIAVCRGLCRGVGCGSIDREGIEGSVTHPCHGSVSPNNNDRQGRPLPGAHLLCDAAGAQGHRAQGADGPGGVFHGAAVAAVYVALGVGLSRVVSYLWGACLHTHRAPSRKRSCSGRWTKQQRWRTESPFVPESVVDRLRVIISCGVPVPVVAAPMTRP